ncbi:hypothetical protein ONS96_007720 [Cadophora gregata f. sp. sojae]|nr:hypothetical protein ONS96_007720 [Cadophora gregata f. sp. sojae]
MSPSADRWRHGPAPIATTLAYPPLYRKEVRMDEPVYTELQRNEAGIYLSDPVAEERRSSLFRGSVLLILWENDRSSNLSLLQQLAAGFQRKFMLDTEIWKIPMEKSQFRVHMKVLEFAQQSEKYPLLVVCYAGDGRLTTQRRLEWTSPAKASDETIQTVKWSGIQSVLEEAKSDVLLIFSCCASMVSNPDCHGALECIAASGFGTGENSAEPFFRSLIQVLTELRTSSNPIAVITIYVSLLGCLHQMIQAGAVGLSTPVHTSMNHESTRSIILSPGSTPFGFESSMLPTGSEYQSSISTSNSTAGKKRKRASKDVRRERPYQCTHIKSDGTYCLKENTYWADWKRHEETHWPQRRWECLLQGTNESVTCHVCNGTVDLAGQHSNSHALCIGNVLRMGHEFHRKDKLIHHVLEAHGCRANVDTWYVDIHSDWKRQCGFCGAVFTTWDERCTHVSEHFAAGLRMVPDWKDPWPDDHENADNDNNENDD